MEIVLLAGVGDTNARAIAGRHDDELAECLERERCVVGAERSDHRTVMANQRTLFGDVVDMAGEEGFLARAGQDAAGDVFFAGDIVVATIAVVTMGDRALAGEFAFELGLAGAFACMALPN